MRGDGAFATLLSRAVAARLKAVECGARMAGPDGAARCGTNTGDGGRRAAIGRRQRGAEDAALPGPAA